MHAYCLYCRTQDCRIIARELELAYEDVKCIYPQIVQRKWVKGRCTEEIHNWLQGYIFLYSETKLERRYDIPGVIRVLGNDELKGENLAFAQMLLEHDGVVGTVRLIEVGDRCTIDDPLWRHLQGTVIKIDRGRKRCCIDITFDDAHRSIWVGYELIKPQDAVSNSVGRYE